MSPSLKERLRALFALSGETLDEKKECPSIDDLAALIDGNLSSGKREALMAHLDTCPDCYHEWLAASSILSENAQTLSADPIHMPSTDFFNAVRSRFSIAFAVAASLALLIYFNILKQPPLQSLINQQYQIVMEVQKHDTRVGHPSEPPDMKSKTVKSQYGFAGSSQAAPSPFAQTFKWGFQTGRTMLSEKEKTFNELESENKTYFWAGRWIALLSYLCETDENHTKEFWETQHRTTQILLEDFNRHVKHENDAVILARSLQRIDMTMMENSSDPCRVIVSEINFILAGMNISN